MNSNFPSGQGIEAAVEDHTDSPFRVGRVFFFLVLRTVPALPGLFCIRSNNMSLRLSAFGGRASSLTAISRILEPKIREVKFRLPAIELRGHRNLLSVFSFARA